MAYIAQGGSPDKTKRRWQDPSNPNIIMVGTESEFPAWILVPTSSPFEIVKNNTTLTTPLPAAASGGILEDIKVSLTLIEKHLADIKALLS